MKKIKTLTIALAFIAVVLTTGQSFAGILLDRIVAVVNSEAITWGELYRAMEFELSSDMKNLSVEQKKAVFEENESLFLENMINQRIQLQEANRLRIGTSAAEVTAAIEEIKRKFNVDDTQFVRGLQKDGFTLDEYRQMLSEQLVIARLVDAVVKSRINITDDELKALPQGDVFYRLRQIFFKEGAGAQDKADKVMAELESGANFALLAREYSEDPLAQSGGDLGLVQKSKMAGKFAEALDGLSLGDVSQPFRTENGIHILKIEEVRSIRDVYTEQRLEEAYSDWLRTLRENSFIDIRL